MRAMNIHHETHQTPESATKAFDVRINIRRGDLVFFILGYSCFSWLGNSGLHHAHNIAAVG